MITGGAGRDAEGRQESLYAAFNMHKDPLEFHLPSPPDGTRWHLLADTTQPSPEDFHEPGDEPVLEPGRPVTAFPHSVILCVGRPRPA